MASAHPMAVAKPICHFSNVCPKVYPPRYMECDDGPLVRIEKCQERDRHDGLRESFFILLRTGYLNQYDKDNKWHICDKHRRQFELRFIMELKQAACKFPGHKSGKPVQEISLARSRRLLSKDGLVAPYQMKVCQDCSRTISNHLLGYEATEIDQKRPHGFL